MTPDLKAICESLRYDCTEGGERDPDDVWAVLDALDAAERRAAEAEGLLSRAVKYAREDRMRTPGLTRLARVLAEAERSLALASVATGGQGGEGA